jgi:GTP-binding protein HflX
VESFKSTLDEVRECDILLHVVDLSHPQYEDHIRTVQQTLLDLGAQDKQTLMVYNKIDRYRTSNYDDLLDQDTKNHLEQELAEYLQHTYGDLVMISAHTKEGIDQLRDKMDRLIKEAYVVRYPHQAKAW